MIENQKIIGEISRAFMAREQNKVIIQAIKDRYGFESLLLFSHFPDQDAHIYRFYVHDKIVEVEQNFASPEEFLFIREIEKISFFNKSKWRDRTRFRLMDSLDSKLCGIE